MQRSLHNGSDSFFRDVILAVFYVDEQPVEATEDVLWRGASGGRGEAAGQEKFSLQLTVALQDHVLQHGPVPASYCVEIE